MIPEDIIALAKAKEDGLTPYFLSVMQYVSNGSTTRIAEQIKEFRESHRSAEYDTPLWGYCQSILEATQDYWSGENERAAQTFNGLLTSGAEPDTNTRGLIYMLAGGNVRSLGDFEQATKYLLEARELLDPCSLLSTYALYVHYQLGEIHRALGDLTEAEKHYNDGIALSDIAIGNNGLFRLHSGLGNLFRQQGKLDEAHNHLEQALAFADSKGQRARIVHDMAALQESIGNLDRAEQLAQESHDLRLESDLRDAASSSLIQLGRIRLGKDKNEEALEALEQALSISIDFKSVEKQMEIHRLLSQAHEAQQNWKVALDHHKKHLALKEELSTRQEREILKLKNERIAEQKREIEEKNKEITDSITYAKRIQTAILPPERIVEEHLPNSFVLYKPKDIVAGDFYWMEVVYSGSPPSQGGVPEGGGGSLSNLPYLKSFRRELRNNLTPAEAKLWTLLSGKKLEGRKFRRQHSIGNYIIDFYCPAERLAIELDGEVHNNLSQAEYDQERTEFLNQFGVKVIRFENRVVFENPEMLLSAICDEFGWMEREEQPPRPSDTPPSQGGEQKWIYFAAADCTGHGVPGAMVSVICVNGLNRSMREFELRDPAAILNKCRELVIKEFEKSDEEVKDGMDISLCALNPQTRELKWAGANNPLWVVRRTETSRTSASVLESAGPEALAGPVLEEIKADKQPIGKYGLEKPFTSHAIQLNEGDTIYLSSDGFPDQFGGEAGKKYKSGKFKRTLVELSTKPITEQRELLYREFENWRGTHEQVDDVCVIGVGL